ncbi:MAG: SPOCS domain-containing protein [Eubacteriales bacterium]
MKDQMSEKEIWTGGSEKASGIDCTKDVILPDLYRDMKKILWYTGSLHPESVYMDNAKASYEGTLSCTVLFLDEEDQVRCMKASLDYSGSVPVEGSGAKCRILSLPVLESLSIKALNPRKLGVRGKISPGIRCFTAADSEPKYPDFFGNEELDCIESQYATLKQMVPTAVWERELTVIEDLALEKNLPSVEEVLSCTASVETVSVRAGDGVLEFKGEAHIEFAYLADDGQIVFRSRTLPVEQMCQAEGVDGSSEVLAAAYVKSAECSPAEDMSGQYRILGLDLTYEICGICTTPVETRYVTDLYSTGYLSENRMASYNCATDQRTLSQTFSRKITVPCEDKGSPAAVYGSAVMGSAQVREEDTGVRMTANLTVMLCDADGKLSAVPVIDSFDGSLPPCKELMGTATVQNPSVKQEGDSLILTYDVKLSLLCWDTARITAVSEVRTTESDRIVSARPLTVYYPAPGENLWQIAKRYRISRASLDAANRGREQGQAMIIPRRIKA